MAVPAFAFVEAFGPLLPYGLGFAAGAMTWMVFAELLPDARREAPNRLVAVVVALCVFGMLAFQILVRWGRSASRPGGSSRGRFRPRRAKPSANFARFPEACCSDISARPARRREVSGPPVASRTFCSIVFIGACSPTP